MKWDNWGLPVTDDGSIDNSCKDLAIYFINVYCYKKNFDREFKLNHPQRAREATETVEDYDNYLTQHLNAYRDLLSKQRLQHMQDADVHLSDKLNSLMYNGNMLTIHPQLGRVMNRYNLAPMLVCLLLYDFSDMLKAQDTSYAPQLKDIQLRRANAFYRTIGDIFWTTFILLKSEPDTQLAYLVLNKATNTETFLSKLAKKIFFTKYKDYGNFWDATVRWLKT